jgi:glycosyltransferase involved in cell wall biosynthesis
MKILHVITTIEMGGAEKQLNILVKEQIRSGVDVTIVNLKGGSDLESSFVRLGAEVNKFLVGLSFLVQIHFMMRYLRQESFDLVHSHLPRSNLLVALANKKTPHVCTFHNSEQFITFIPRFLSSYVARRVNRRSSCAIAISESVKHFLLYTKEIPKHHKVRVIPYAYDSDFVSNSTLPRHKKVMEINADSRALRIGTIARLEVQKNLETLIIAFTKLQTEQKRLHLVGDGSQKEKLEALVSSLNLQNHVTFEGKITSVVDFLLGIDVFVLPSLYEGFGLVLLEAMQCQIPIVASDIPVIREVLGSNHPGLAMVSTPSDFADKIFFVANDPGRLKALNLQSSRLQYFTPEKLLVSISELYNEFTGKGS